MVAESANRPQQERVLSPFFDSRNVGAKVTHVFGERHRATVSLGVFNDWWSTGDDIEDSGTDITGRITGLLWDNHERRRFLHLGVGARYAGADNDTLRYKGRPESNVTPNFVDTGNLIADHAMHLGLEALFNEGPFSILAEYVRAWVDSPGSGDPEFSGWYVLGSYVLTGETRHYDRTLGYARRVMPEHHWGAPEIVVQYSNVDLDDGAVQGGSFHRIGVGVNWWATRRAKVGFSYGHIELDRFGTEGGTDAYQARLQWVY